MRQGFSLVELSIVLVILGLLVGGILAGQSLIRASELRSVATDAQRYRTAVYAFKDKYFAWPGDMSNATSIWGAAHATPATCRTTSSTTTTCDGNGDSIVSASTGSLEWFRFWQHLANAGLIEGVYNGIDMSSNTSGIGSVPGSNIPRGKISNSGFAVNYVTTGGGAYAGDAWTFAGHYAPFVWVFGGELTNNLPVTNILRGEEAWNIDTKLDDGMAAQGRVLARNWGNCTNASATTDTVATYLLNSTGQICSLYFMMR